MKHDSKIYVAGSSGLVGSAIVRRLHAGGYHNVIARTRRTLDLVNQQKVAEFFDSERPEYVFLAAGKVGGIQANNTLRADFIYQNLMMQSNVIHSAHRFGVKKLLFLGSSCIYPKHAPQPIREECLLTSALEPTNEPYAIAKIAGIKMCGAYNRQYHTNFISVMPTNLYGPGDHYDLETSHVIPALIRKMHEAKTRRDPQAVIWGSGTPRREFLYCEDLADACVFLMERYDATEIGETINVGTGVDCTIRELAELIADVVGFRGKLVFDSTRPDGTPRKVLDVARMKILGWQASTPLRDGLIRAYGDYRLRFAEAEAVAPVALDNA